MWYMEYFRDSTALVSTYKVHFAMIGKQIPADKIYLFLDYLFTPWVSQIYLTLACFNLARKSSELFKEDLVTKLKFFGMLFFFFLLENFIVAPDTGEAISFYPIMLWMIVMGIISILYAYFGIVSIVGLALISMLRWILPIEGISESFEMLMINQVHPSFEYDARIEYFLSSGCLGFILGYVHYHKRSLSESKDYIFASLGVFFIAIYYFFGERYIQDATDVFAHEHDLAKTFSGTLYILGIQAAIISLFLLLEKKSIKFKIPILNWVGENSLIIFSLHRIFFVRVLAPISLLIGAFYGHTLGASTLEVYTYIIITILFCYFVKKSRIGDLILQRNN